MGELIKNGMGVVISDPNIDYQEQKMITSKKYVKEVGVRL